jgi:hypothetical protein
VKNAVLDAGVHSMESVLKKDEIQLGGDGVKSILNSYNVSESIAEYIWNGFDAGATQVDISYEDDEFTSLKYLKITDNGKGIPQEELSVKFKPFHESEKARKNTDPRHHSLLHGKNGVGRLTFFTFANVATWETTYRWGRACYRYDIEIHSSDLQNYTGGHTNKEKVNGSASSTQVTFEGLRELSVGMMETSIVPYLLREFCWFLELFKDKGFKITVNGDRLQHEDLIESVNHEIIVHKETATRFNVKYIQWKQKLNKEYSRYYLVDSTHNERWKSTTLLNNKGDRFYHSVYVQSDYFDSFIYDEKEDENKQVLRSEESKFNNQHDDEYKHLLAEFNDYLRRLRSPHLQKVADDLVEKFEKEKILPEIKNEWDIPRSNELKQLIKGVFQIEPKIFSDSSTEQKKTFVHLLNALLDSDRRDQIYTIIDSVVRLDPNEQDRLAELLKANELDGIIHTIRMINNRYVTIDALREVVFNKKLKALEPNHLQKILDHNFWVFGEQYNLVASTEDKFEKALSEYLYILRDDDSKSRDKVTMESLDKDTEMDLFLCRKSVENDKIHNLVIELKRPTILLGEKEVSQLKKYQRTIFSDARFNGENTLWEFILVGNKFNTSGFIEGEIKTNSAHGEKDKGLIFASENCRVYVRKWSDVFADIECRHKFLQDELETKRDLLTAEYAGAEDAVKRAILK